ncbi:DUF4148 domain-containing protein [Ramlibacter rhizophilus]|uniref:DUF4148 domain-containing protein n=1 Tax=Ramlibacter rhizophilus TaxID=1781167 RepID=A0A4Z0BHT9_9BURK|nr:DUF4148 domain-containing protein [Ramlibacter rhizophilus]TFY97468.1 DUF4148 domain-containing protein [Ramlibacter rhizophilus]
MNRYALAIAFATLAAAGQSFADDITIDDQPFVSSASRAQVQQELAQFKDLGVDPWALDYNPLVEFRSTTSRASVVAEYIASRDAVAAFSGEDSGSSFLAAGQSDDSRASTVAGQPSAAL